jgi:two-component system cell cycle sensor histidine kinase/response regulator CckA
MSEGQQISILVVDDDDMVRRLVSVSLRNAGYFVMEAGSGTEALELLSRENTKVGVLVTDIRMPGMDGIELVRRVRDGHPCIKVLYMTGFTDQPVEPGATVLQKPFEPDVLRKHVARSLKAPCKRSRRR